MHPDDDFFETFNEEIRSHKEILLRNKSGEYVEQSVLEESRFALRQAAKILQVWADLFDDKISEEELNSKIDEIENEKMKEWWKSA